MVSAPEMLQALMILSMSKNDSAEVLPPIPTASLASKTWGDWVSTPLYILTVLISISCADLIILTATLSRLVISILVIFSIMACLYDFRIIVVTKIYQSVICTETICINFAKYLCRRR